MLLILLRSAIVDNKRFEVGVRDHGRGPIGGVNLGVDRVIEEFVD